MSRMALASTMLRTTKRLMALSWRGGRRQWCQAVLLLALVTAGLCLHCVFTCLPWRPNLAVFPERILPVCARLGAPRPPATAPIAHNML